MFTLDVSGFASELGTRWVNVRAAVRAGMRRGVAEGVKEGAAEAKLKRRFTSRTGDLLRSISGRVTGSSDTEHRGEIVATMKYASYVEHGTRRSRAYPFLAFAYTKCERVMIREIERGVAQAQALLNR